MESYGINNLTRIDTDATLATVHHVRDTLQAVFEEKLSTLGKGRPLVAPMSSAICASRTTVGR